MDQTEAVFTGIVFAIGTFTGIVRSGRDRSYRGIDDLIWVGLFAGCLAFIGSTVGRVYGGWSDPICYSVAAGIGVFGREITDTVIDEIVPAVRSHVKNLIGWLIKHFCRFFGIEIDSTVEQRDKPGSLDDDSIERKHVDPLPENDQHD